MKKQITTYVIIVSIISFVAGYYTAYKKEAVTDDQLKEFFDENVAKTFIDQFYQHEVYATYHVAKTLQSIRDNNTLNQNDIDRLESILKDNDELFDVVYREYPEGPVLEEKVVKQIEFIKSYRAKYMREQP
jgi:hypothetical protein